ncbi:hypothetical protein ACHHYP_02065 [Achlya hypogyna]|uniref:Uncharacterized protein n=1 Tax=Achlya hypogyna TaxID=1202772 RepID=A0A1V9ZSJ8_ACHHY|nr:hypothetical protein ACHHYP_02065 [Achlya hypogyna]
MSILAHCRLYTGPMLQAYADFAEWKDGFMDHAEGMHLAEYLSVKDYDDPNLADYISPAKMHLFTTSAEQAEPDVPSGLSATAYEDAWSRRQRHVKDRVTLAVMNECSAIKTRSARYAKAYLLSAIDEALHDDLRSLPGAFEVWEMLRTRGHVGDVGSTDLLGAFDQLAVVKYIRREEAGHFFARYEAAAERYLRPLLAPAGAVDASARSGVVRCRAAIADKVKATFLAHAFAPHLVHEFDEWHRARPDGGYDYLKSCVQSQLANLPPDAFSLDRSVLGLQQPTQCGYCHSQLHTDMACRHLFLAQRDGITRPSYTGGAVPLREADTIIDPDRRFCTYCQSHKHSDARCKRLAEDTRTGSVRRTYAPLTAEPPSKRPRTETPTARFCGYCDSIYHQDAACTKLAAALADGSVRAGYAVASDAGRDPDHRRDVWSDDDV